MSKSTKKKELKERKGPPKGGSVVRTKGGAAAKLIARAKKVGQK